MTWRPDGPQGNEASKIKHLIVPYTRGKGLDLGCGPWKAWPHFISVDDGDEWGGFQWTPDVWGDATDLSMFADNALDFVFSSHLLEHIEDHEAALAEWWRVIKPGGHLVLYLPHRDLYPNIGEDGANPDHRHDFDNQDILEAMGALDGWDCIEDEKRDRDDETSDIHEYSFLQVYRKRTDGEQCYIPWRKPDKSCLVIRYGAFGDQIMTAAVLPGLKEQGYHITYNTTARGHEVQRENPYIDAFLLQDRDQVPNEELCAYWSALEQRFGHIVNLCESVEGSLIALPGRIQHAWSDSARQKILGSVNYVENTANIAGVAYRPEEARFYPTEEELVWAQETGIALGGRPLILWAVGGSAIHKKYPWAHIAMTQLVMQTGARIICVGAPEDQLIEVGVAWAYLQANGMEAEELQAIEDEHGDKALQVMAGKMKDIAGYDPIVFRCGAWSIRQTMAISHIADCVVGPETGVLNAVAMRDVPKVVMLSHSSHENLTRDWINTTVLVPEVDCHPCHRLHYSFVHCHESEDAPGAAICAASIDPRIVFEAVAQHLSQSLSGAA